MGLESPPGCSLHSWKGGWLGGPLGGGRACRGNVRHARRLWQCPGQLLSPGRNGDPPGFRTVQQDPAHRARSRKPDPVPPGLPLLIPGQKLASRGIHHPDLWCQAGVQATPPENRRGRSCRGENKLSSKPAVAGSRHGYIQEYDTRIAYSRNPRCNRFCRGSLRLDQVPAGRAPERETCPSPAERRPSGSVDRSLVLGFRSEDLRLPDSPARLHLGIGAEGSSPTGRTPSENNRRPSIVHIALQSNFVRPAGCRFPAHLGRSIGGSRFHRGRETHLPRHCSALLDPIPSTHFRNHSGNRPLLGALARRARIPHDQRHPPALAIESPRGHPMASRIDFLRSEPLATGPRTLRNVPSTQRGLDRTGQIARHGSDLFGEWIGRTRGRGFALLPQERRLPIPSRGVLGVARRLDSRPASTSSEPNSVATGRIALSCRVQTKRPRQQSRQGHKLSIINQNLTRVRRDAD